MSVVTFNPDAAVAAAASIADERYENVVARAAEGRDDLLRLAREYAEHLADGGDPRTHPAVPWSGGDRLIRAEVGLIEVYRAWNEARGSSNPVWPIQNRPAWQVAELLHANVGTPVAFADLSAAFGGGRGRGGSASEVARAAALAQTGELVVRKTKVDGKVAYLLRERQDGERPATASNVPEEAS